MPPLEKLCLLRCRHLSKSKQVYPSFSFIRTVVLPFLSIREGGEIGIVGPGPREAPEGKRMLVHPC